MELQPGMSKEVYLATLNEHRCVVTGRNEADQNLDVEALSGGSCDDIDNEQGCKPMRS